MENVQPCIDFFVSLKCLDLCSSSRVMVVMRHITVDVKNPVNLPNYFGGFPIEIFIMNRLKEIHLPHFGCQYF